MIGTEEGRYRDVHSIIIHLIVIRIWEYFCDLNRCGLGLRWIVARDIFDKRECFCVCDRRRRTMCLREEFWVVTDCGMNGEV